MIRKHLESSKQIIEQTPTGKHFKHPVAVPVAVTILMILTFCFWFLLYGGHTLKDADVKRVEVYLDGQTRTVPTRASTVGELLDRIGVTLQKEDVVEPGINSPILDDDFKVSVYHARPVTVVDEDGRTVTAKIAESTPHALAKKAGFKVYPEDYINFGQPDQALLEDGVVGDLVLIKRSIPVTINLYGKDIKTRTLAKDVEGLLGEKNISINPEDKFVPNLRTKIKKNLRIFILRPGQKIINEEEQIVPPTEVRYDATLDVGVTKVIDEGEPGIRIVTYQIEVKKGKVVNRNEIQSVISVQPKPRVVVEGTKTAGFDGSFDGALARLRSCEGSYSSNTGNGYYGAYQFDIGTWGGYGGYSHAAEAPPAVQDQKAWETYQGRGWSPWPSCSRSLGLQDIYR
ncbi:MAG: ubiquitin-like domain-containing protein [Candidatus Saccharimonadales bacterium]